MTKVRFTSPVGRFVQGDLDEPQTKDAQGQFTHGENRPQRRPTQPAIFYRRGVRQNRPRVARLLGVAR
jgi:hypothetical protein